MNHVEPFTRRHLFNDARRDAESAAHGIRLMLGLAPPVWRGVGHKARWHLRVDPDRATCPGCGETFGEEEPRCMREARAAAHEKTLREGWQDAIPAHMDAAGFPRRLAQKTFENFTARKGATRAMQACQGYAEAFEVGKTEGGLYLSGPWGSGKSHLAKATGERIIHRTLANVLFLTALDVEEQVKGGIGNGGSTVVQDAEQAELLILDDLGQDTAPTPFTRKLIFGIVDHRYRANLPMIVSSNVADAVLADQYGGALVDRLYECTAFVPVTAQSYRKEMAAHRSG